MIYDVQKNDLNNKLNQSKFIDSLKMAYKVVGITQFSRMRQHKFLIRYIYCYGYDIYIYIHIMLY